MPEPVQGVDPRDAEQQQGTALEELIAAALAAVAVQAAAAALVAGVPSPGALGMITDLWWPYVDRDFMPILETVYHHSAETIRDSLRAAFGAAGQDIPAPGIPELPPLPPIVDVTGAEILSQARNRLRHIGDDLWHNARDSMVKGMGAGETIPELAQRVKDAARVTERRARVIARTEVLSANSAASVAQARSSGYRLNKVWIATTHDTRTRPAHLAANGQTVPLNDMFEVGGEMLDCPGDPRGRPDNIISCRCVLGYELDAVDVVTAGAVHRPALACCREYKVNGRHPPGPCKGWKGAPAAPNIKAPGMKAAAPRARKPAGKGKTAVPPAADIRDRAKDLGSKPGGSVSRSLRGGAFNAGIELIDFPDGSKAVRKKIAEIPAGDIYPDRAVTVDDQRNAEVLASLVAGQLGINAPAVVAEDDKTVLMDFMDGDLALSMSREDRDKTVQKNLSQARRIALFDTLIDNTDRNAGNWLTDAKGNFQLIDHGSAFGYSAPDDPPEGLSSFSGLMFSGGLFSDNDFSPDDMADVRSRLETLKPDFDAARRSNWHELMMRRLAAVTPYAKGKERNLT